MNTWSQWHAHNMPTLSRMECMHVCLVKHWGVWVGCSVLPHDWPVYIERYDCPNITPWHVKARECELVYDPNGSPRSALSSSISPVDYWHVYKPKTMHLSNKSNSQHTGKVFTQLCEWLPSKTQQKTPSFCRTNDVKHTLYHCMQKGTDCGLDGALCLWFILSLLSLSR